jgi:hypothetical protein
MIMVAAAPAMAAAPSNDNRANAQVVNVPSVVTGTTVDATLEQGEDRFVCDGETSASVWYKFTANGERGVVATLTANGNLDAEIDVYQQRRSQLVFTACDVTDEHGLGAAGFRVTDGATYFIRVAEQPNSEANSFSLKLVQGPTPAEPPGQSLASGHARGTLDRLLKIDAAYHLHLNAGTPYRFNFVHDPSTCLSMQLFPPGTRDFDRATPVLSRRCGGYAIYTPAPHDGGRYFIRIKADRRDRDDQPYRLLAGKAAHDDIAPGRLLRNHAHHGGKVDGAGLDVRDVYRFNVGFRSQLDLHLVGPPHHKLQLDLRDAHGKPISCACTPGPRQSISLRIKRGRYYVAVAAAAQQHSHYVLSRKSRTITASTADVDGRPKIHVLRGQAVDLGVTVRPGGGGGGEAQFTIQHFDPFQGWLPYRQRQVEVKAGQGSLHWTPPTLGRWRVQADYLGTRDFAPSESQYVHVLVAKPLTP